MNHHLKKMHLSLNKYILILITIMTIGVNKSYGQQSNDSLLLKNISLEEIEISGRRTPTINSEMGRVVSIITRDEISKLPVTSTADILEYVGNIDVRTRGVNGVQSDLSFRGGTFDQVMIHFVLF